MLAEPDVLDPGKPGVGAHLVNLPMQTVHHLLDRHIATAEKCLDWIDRYGDRDGDGFQEYQTYSSLGYENVGWKDAGEAVVYADGSQVKQPKGLCELQGYTYDAKMRMAEIVS